MRFALKLVTGPEVEPVSLANVKARLAVTIEDMDTDISLLLAECRAACEGEVGRAFITQTWSMFLDRFPCGRRDIVIPRPPLQSVTWVKYRDANGDEQTLSASAYFVATAREPGQIVLKRSESWPATECGNPEAVEVRFVAGYGDAATSIPPDVRHAILLTVAERWDNPTGTVDVPPGARRVLNGAETGQVW